MINEFKAQSFIFIAPASDGQENPFTYMVDFCYVICNCQRKEVFLLLLMTSQESGLVLYIWGVKKRQSDHLEPREECCVPSFCREGVSPVEKVRE